jgi:hypothetical protein
MKRFTIALAFSALLLSGYLVAATDVATSWSDGMAGASGAVPQHLRKCAEGFKYCKVKVSGCGGCHGDFEAMQAQRQSEQPVIDRIDAELWLNGRESNWEYTPGSTTPMVVDLYIITKRAQGRYNTATFDLNASAGRFELFDRDDTLRITGGSFSHAGSKEKSYKICHPQNPTDCRQYGATVDDESQYKGELTTTGKGSNLSKTKMPDGTPAYHWRAKWFPPAKVEPHGVAFQMAFMVPNNDAIDTCVHVECNATKGYSNQDEVKDTSGKVTSPGWDWWTFMIPRKIVCEKGTNRADCEKKVYAFILPPAPPVNTGGPGDDDGGGIGGISPMPPGGAIVALLAAAMMVLRRRRPGVDD